MPAVGPLLKTIEELNARIRDYDHKLEEIASEFYPETNLLRQVQGVGELTALAFILVLEDPYRFEKSRTMGAIPGTRPGEGPVRR